MKPLLHPCLWIALLLVSCDKPQEVDARDSNETSPPRVTRTERARRQETSETHSQYRKAFQAAQEIQTPAEREKAIAQVAWNALELDPELAREALQQLSADSAGRIRLIQHFAMRLAERNPDEALAWAATAGTELEIAAAHGQIALVISNTDPERAANILSESGVAGHGFDVAAVQVLQRWASQSAPEAAAWVVVFPAGKAREAGIRTVVSQWAAKDAKSAFAWMATLEDEALRRETALAMAVALNRQTEDIRNAWLQHADPATRSAIEQQKDQAMRETGMETPPPSE